MECGCPLGNLCSLLGCQEHSNPYAFFLLVECRGLRFIVGLTVVIASSLDHIKIIVFSKNEFRDYCKCMRS